MLFADGKPPQLQMRAKNDKEVNQVKKASGSNLKIVNNGDNNKTTVNVSDSHPVAVAIIRAVGLVAAATVLAVSHCYPNLDLTEIARVISLVLGG